ncbi:hypothetical protein ACM66B_002010 [Microbotryomycetes sp. NB124-2]
MDSDDGPLPSSSFPELPQPAQRLPSDAHAREPWIPPTSPMDLSPTTSSAAASARPATPVNALPIEVLLDLLISLDTPPDARQRAVEQLHAQGVNRVNPAHSAVHSTPPQSPERRRQPLPPQQPLNVNDVVEQLSQVVQVDDERHVHHDSSQQTDSSVEIIEDVGPRQQRQADEAVQTPASEDVIDEDGAEEREQDQPMWQNVRIPSETAALAIVQRLPPLQATRDQLRDVRSRANRSWVEQSRLFTNETPPDTSVSTARTILACLVVLRDSVITQNDDETRTLQPRPSRSRLFTAHDRTDEQTKKAIIVDATNRASQYLARHFTLYRPVTSNVRQTTYRGVVIDTELLKRLVPSGAFNRLFFRIDQVTSEDNAGIRWQSFSDKFEGFSPKVAAVRVGMTEPQLVRVEGNQAATAVSIPGSVANIRAHPGFSDLLRFVNNQLDSLARQLAGSEISVDQIEDFDFLWREPDFAALLLESMRRSRTNEGGVIACHSYSTIPANANQLGNSNDEPWWVYIRKRLRQHARQYLAEHLARATEEPIQDVDHPLKDAPGIWSIQRITDRKVGGKTAIGDARFLALLAALSQAIGACLLSSWVPSMFDEDRNLIDVWNNNSKAEMTMRTIGDAYVPTVVQPLVDLASWTEERTEFPLDDIYTHGTVEDRREERLGNFQRQDGFQTRHISLRLKNRLASVQAKIPDNLIELSQTQHPPGRSQTLGGDIADLCDNAFPTVPLSVIEDFGAHLDTELKQIHDSHARFVAVLDMLQDGTDSLTASNYLFGDRFKALAVPDAICLIAHLLKRSGSTGVLTRQCCEKIWRFVLVVLAFNAVSARPAITAEALPFFLSVKDLDIYSTGHPLASRTISELSMLFKYANVSLIMHTDTLTVTLDHRLGVEDDYNRNREHSIILTGLFTSFRCISCGRALLLAPHNYPANERGDEPSRKVSFTTFGNCRVPDRALWGDGALDNVWSLHPDAEDRKSFDKQNFLPCFVTCCFPSIHDSEGWTAKKSAAKITHIYAKKQGSRDRDVPHSVAPDALVAVLDFQKAYDRVAHDYLEAILEAFGFGPRARQWYASTFSRQCARVYLNGWLSRAFPIQSGVRQGDPLAPSLFALAIEGLAALIREKVKGREGSITYTASFGAARFERKDESLRFRELLFADDVACGLADFQDADRLEFCIRRYCAASGSRLNVDKSFIYPIGPCYRHAPAHFNWLRVDDTPFRYLGVMVGRNVNDRAQWDEILRKAVRRMQSIPMHDLPVATKAQIINIYVFSKVVFYDRFVPAPVDVLHTLKQAAFDVIRGHATRLPVGATRLLTPTDLGGFGLHDLPLRLRGARAQWVFKTLSSTPPLAVNARVPPYVAFLRHWWSMIALAARQSPWRREFRFRDVERACWTLPFVFSRSVGVHGLSLGVEQAIIHIFAKLPPRWQSYLDAWHIFCPLRRPRHLQLPPRARGPAVPPFRELVLALGNSADAVVPMAWFQRIGQPADFDPETPLAFTDFARPSPTVHVAHYDIIKPGTWLEHVQAPVAKWIEVWAILKQVRRNFPDEEDTFHRFLLYNWHVGKHVGGSRLDLFPNNVKACALCQRGELHFDQRPGAPGRFELVETLEHLVVHCPR